MGASWRIGVAADERTELVTSGIYARVRNPIFTCVLATVVGFCLMWPTAAMLAGFALLWLAIELQVRRVEEPHLARVHGAAWAEYCRHTGRYLLRLGARNFAAASLRECAPRDQE